MKPQTLQNTVLLYDFQRLKFRVATNPSNPYVTNIVDDGSGVLRMEGMFADVFHALQVKRLFLN